MAHLKNSEAQTKKQFIYFYAYGNYSNVQVQTGRGLSPSTKDGRVCCEPPPGGKFRRETDGAVRRTVIVLGDQQAGTLQASLLQILNENLMRQNMCSELI